MKKVFNYIFIFLYGTLSAQIQISYNDIISLSSSTFLNKNNDTLLYYNVEKDNYIKVKKAKPFPEITVISSSKIIFESSGFIKELENGPNKLSIKIIRPSCCCLNYKEITLFQYNKLTYEKSIDVIRVNNEVLFPIQDLVFTFFKVDLKKDSIELFKYPEKNIDKRIDECTGEIINGNKIGVYNPLVAYIIYDDMKWKLYLIKYSEGNIRHWIIGWSDI